MKRSPLGDRYNFVAAVEIQDDGDRPATRSPASANAGGHIALLGDNEEDKDEERHTVGLSWARHSFVQPFDDSSASPSCVAATVTLARGDTAAAAAVAAAKEPAGAAVPLPGLLTPMETDTSVRSKRRSRLGILKPLPPPVLPASQAMRPQAQRDGATISSGGQESASASTAKSSHSGEFNERGFKAVPVSGMGGGGAGAGAGAGAGPLERERER